MKKLPELKDVATDQQTAGLQLDARASTATPPSRLGITPQAIDDTLYDAYGQRQVATTYTQLNQYHVVLEVKPQFSERPERARRALRAARRRARRCRCATLAQPSVTSTPLAVNHQGQFPAVTLSFNLAPGVVARPGGRRHPPRPSARSACRASVHAAFQGTAQAFTASLTSEPLLILLALLAVYIVLGMLYESYVHPITILSTLPSAGVGALLALLLFKTELSIIALIGIILLIGIVKKNAIMMIDFAIEAERERGASAEEAIRKACLLRFRPILMTTCAALLGALPLAFGTGIGSELRQPLGITIVGGLLVSQMLTLFTTPVVYLALDRLSHRKRRAEAAGSVLRELALLGASRRFTARAERARRRRQGERSRSEPRGARPP